MNRDEIWRIAAVLYDGGWRSEDGDELAGEYGLTPDETEALVTEIKKLEDARC